jgi:hypothetical protein
MKPLEGQINLKVENNTVLTQPVSILGIVPNQNTANNNNLLYEYDLTGQIYVGVTSVTILIYTTSSPFIIPYLAPVISQSIIGVVSALNTLNVGLFYYSGNTIYVSSDFYIYTKLTV